MELLDLDLLRTFVLAADKKSFAKAAVHVFRLQSAVSLQMQRLEAIVGQQLFIKQGRGWHLTDAGDLLLGYARKMIELNDAAIIALSKTSLAGPIRLGARIDFLEGGLPRILADFTIAHPAVQVEITVDKEDVLLQKLSSGGLDIVVTFGQNLPHDAIPIGTTPMRWIGNGDMYIARQEPLPLLLFEAPCLFRNAALAALAEANRNWRPVLTASSVAGMWAGAQAGLGIAIRTEIGLPAGCKVIPRSAGLPALPSIHLFILKAKQADYKAIEHLIHIIQSTLNARLKSNQKNK